MRIFVQKDRLQGGFQGYLCDRKMCRLELPSPYNKVATSFHGESEEVVVQKCREESKKVFGVFDVKPVKIK